MSSKKLAWMYLHQNDDGDVTGSICLHLHALYSVIRQDFLDTGNINGSIAKLVSPSDREGKRIFEQFQKMMSKDPAVIAVAADTLGLMKGVKE